MFDRYYPTQTVDRTQYVTCEVVEKRAPTDESVKLLMEMEKAARAKVIESYRLTDNGFECEVETYRTFADDEVVLAAHFSLNGKRMQAEFRRRGFRQDENVRHAMLEGLRDATAKRIGEEVMATAFKVMPSRFFNGKMEV